MSGRVLGIVYVDSGRVTAALHLLYLQCDGSMVGTVLMQEQMCACAFAEWTPEVVWLTFCGCSTFLITMRHDSIYAYWHMLQSVMGGVAVSVTR